MGRFSMRRTRPRNIRTFIRWTLNRPTGRDCGMPSRTSSASGWIRVCSIFRVDNPHTKAFPFWQWVIPELKAKDPDVLFLAEAFTRPRVMERLAKLGFSAVLHLLHLARHQGRAHAISAGTHHHPGARNTSARISGLTPLTFCPGTCRRVDCPPFAAGWCWPRP